jgi:hypothetical protein
MARLRRRWLECVFPVRRRLHHHRSPQRLTGGRSQRNGSQVVAGFFKDATSIFGAARRSKYNYGFSGFGVLNDVPESHRPRTRWAFVILVLKITQNAKSKSENPFAIICTDIIFLFGSRICSHCKFGNSLELGGKRLRNSTLVAAEIQGQLSLHGQKEDLVRQKWQ